MNKELLLEELDSVFECLKKQDWVEEEGLRLRPLTEIEMNTLDVEISSCIYDMVLDFLRSSSEEDKYPIGSLITVRRLEDDEKLNLLISENSKDEPIWLNLDLTCYSGYDPAFYDEHEVLGVSRLNIKFEEV